MVEACIGPIEMGILAVCHTCLGFQTQKVRTTAVIKQTPAVLFIVTVDDFDAFLHIQQFHPSRLRRFIMLA